MTSITRHLEELSHPPYNLQARWSISPKTKEILKIALCALANVAIIGSLIAGTIIFPHIFIPVWTGTGALLLFHGSIFYLIYRAVH